jgi:hypothetical protein
VAAVVYWCTMSKQSGPRSRPCAKCDLAAAAPEPAHL